MRLCELWVAGILLAAGNGTLQARGTGQEEGAGNLTLQGSRVQAGQNVELVAKNDIHLLASQDQRSLSRTSTSQSNGVSVDIGYNGGWVIDATVSHSQSKGRENGSDTLYNNTTVTAGNTLTLKSGGHTTLAGAVASGKQIAADVAGNLTIESLQDTSTFEARSTSSGGSLTVGTSGYSGSASYGNSTIDAAHTSVTQQSGLRAGDGGFAVNVGAIPP